MIRRSMSAAKSHFAVLALCAFVCTSAAFAQRSLDGVTIKKTSAGYVFTEGSDSVLVYHAEAVHPEREHARPHYVHPLYSLDGAVLTEDFPEDHLHQHGLFWAWHQLFVGELRLGDGWMQDDIEWDVRGVEVAKSGRSAELTAKVSWTSPRYVDAGSEPRPFIEETATLRVHPAQDDYRAVDVEITLRALIDSVRIGGSEDEKGYGGLSLRVRLPQDVRFVGPAGPVQPEVNAVEAGPWVDIAATYGAHSGVAILQHPSNPGYPQPWILRSADSMQNPKWPGEEAVLLPRNEPVTLRYRLVVHRGGARALPLDEIHQRYTTSSM